MNDPLQPVLFGSLFVAGLAASLHCLAMCGPLLIAFSKALDSRRAGEVAPVHSARAPWLRSAADGFYYHAGRIWTYALLGFAAGWAGSRFRLGAALLGWQRPFAVFASLLVLACGLAALGWIPGLRLAFTLPGGCLNRVQGRSWLAALVTAPGRSARLLLGAVMGLLPCGMVYAMLMVVATLPTPVHSALGMLCFGAGTVPALSVLMLGGGALPRWLRARSPRFAALLLVGVGVLMLVRSLLVHPGG